MFSQTDQRGGKITKSAIDVPGCSEQQFKTENMHGSLKKQKRTIQERNSKQHNYHVVEGN